MLSVPKVLGDAVDEDLRAKRIVSDRPSGLSDVMRMSTKSTPFCVNWSRSAVMTIECTKVDGPASAGVDVLHCSRRGPLSAISAE